jgi:uncharacterized DUF497 family protein
MEFEWDDAKRQEVVDRRGIDLLFAAGIFEGRVLTRLDPRDYGGETRLVSIGIVEGDYFVVVHTEREGRTRLITAWRAGRDERRQYQASIAGGDHGDA